MFQEAFRDILSQKPLKNLWKTLKKYHIPLVTSQMQGREPLIQTLPVHPGLEALFGEVLGFQHIVKKQDQTVALVGKG